MDKSTSRLGSIGVDLVDDFVESGSASTSGVMRDANRLWSRMRKSETIERAIAKAETAQAGLEAGLRAEFKTIYRGIIDKQKEISRLHKRRDERDQGGCAGQYHIEHLAAHRQLVGRIRAAACRAEPDPRLCGWWWSRLRHGRAGGRSNRRSGRAGCRSCSGPAGNPSGATPGGLRASGRREGRDADASEPCRADSGDDAMTDPTDSVELMAAVSAILRAAAMQSTAEDGRPSGQAQAMEIDQIAEDLLHAGLNVMSALKDSGDIVAEAFGWPDAASLSAFLATGTRAGETLH